MHTLLQVSERSLALAALAAVCLVPVKSASWKHAVWALVTVAMLLQILLSPVLPTLPLPVLRPVEFVAMPTAVVSVSIPASPPPRAPFPVLPALYLAGVLWFAARLLRAYFFTRRLLRRSERIAPGRYQSREIAVPLTAGSKILLPFDWPSWDAAKLRAVLAHEEAHVRRRDSIVALLARVNRCVFWFHPLAWWLERQLAQLAEQACDDAALAATQDRQEYARTLLDMARAVHTSQGRFMTAAMAKETNVETRINRVLDESRRIPKALGKAAWTILVACAAPLIYFGAVVQLSPAQTLTASPPPPPPGPVVLQAQPNDAPKSIPKAEILDRFRRARNEETLKAELSQPDPQAPRISIAFSPLRSGVLTIPLGDPVAHQVQARLTDPDRKYVGSVDDVITGSSWELPFSLKPGTYRLTVSIKTGNLGTQARLDFTVE